jgi:hypothetical protein
MARGSTVTLHKKVLFHSALVVAIGVTLSGCGTPGPSLKTTDNSFDFGKVVVSQTSTRDVFTVTNSGKDAVTLNSQLQGDASLKLQPNLSCGASLVPGGSCSMAVSFAPATTDTVSGSLNITLTDSSGAATTQTVKISGSGVQLSGGESLVTPTANPLVARYEYQPSVQGTVHVEFGTDTNYGRSTGSVTPVNGGPVSILVAGMKQNTAYHMRAVVTESDGTVVDDQDHTFTTGSFPADILPTLSATTSPGQTPQPGIELLNATASQTKGYLEAYAVDLSGNIIWGYNFQDRPGPNTIIQPIKLLPNGNMLMVISFASQFVLPNQGVTLTPADESVNLIREIDLAGDPVAQLTMDQLNAELASSGHSDIKLSGFHHDVTMLPNGHIIVLASLLKPYSNLTGQSGTVNVLGDVLVDLDPDFNVSWVWSEFDHLDVNRHPVGFPDWTHTNAVVYSPDDGDLLVSMRHQAWIIKIDYENGKGSGDILWRLGNEGDFTLKGGTPPQDWFYGQHDPQFVPGSPSAGQFSMAMMDNGFGRITSSGTCTTSGAACYTTAPIMAIDEATKTATITFRATPPASKFSIWGGSGTALANGDLEYDLCALQNGSEVDEVTTTSPSQPVWTLTETGANLYRAHRIPSLYPGVQW